MIYPFIKSTGAYACPDDSAASPKVSYSMNYTVWNDDFWVASHGLKVGEFVSPSSTVLLYEGKDRNSSKDPSIALNGVNTTGWAGGSDWNTDNAAPLAKWHDNSPDRANNYLAADGHAKYLKASSVSWIAGGTAPNGVPPEKVTGPLVMTFYFGDTQYPG